MSGAGRYNDGLTARSRPVAVEMGAGALILRHDAGEVRWPFAAIEALEADRFAHGDERLALADADLATRLRGAVPVRRRPPPLRKLGFVLAGLALLALFFWKGLPLFAAQVARIVPAGAEQRAGLWLRDAMVRELGQGRVCTAPEGHAVLALLHGNLQRAGEPPRIVHTVIVVAADLPNAFALPGGHIVVTRGLIDFTLHPNELAAVIAHEMGHSDLRHPVENLVKRTAGTFVAGLLFGDMVGAAVLSTTAQVLVAASYTREAEHAADAFAIARLRQAGINTVPVADFFMRMQTRSGLMRGLPGHFSTHPSDAVRAAAMRADSSGHAALSGAQWASLKAICSQTALLGAPAVRPAAAP